MTRWRLETSAQFDKSARKLDRQTVRRVKIYLQEMVEEFKQLSAQGEEVVAAGPRIVLDANILIRAVLGRRVKKNHHRARRAR